MAHSDLSDIDVAVASALRAQRDRSGLSLAQLADLSGISVAHLSRIEKAQRAPTIRILLALSRAYGVSLGTLVGEAEADTVLVSRMTDRVAHREGKSAVNILSRSTDDPGLQALEIDLAAREKSRGIVSHAGDEWINVISGRIVVTIDEVRHDLAEGDAVNFAASHPHEIANPFDMDAQLLLVSTTEIAWHHGAPSAAG